MTTATGKPSYIAHFVIRTNAVEETVAWHKAFFDAHEVYTQKGLTFLTFDDEHHRIAIGQLPELVDAKANAIGIDHIAFSMASVEDLVIAYQRNKKNGIEPYWCINHGPTTSMYYKDPNGVQLEFQVDHSTYPGGPIAFYSSEAFAANPIGVEFDAEEFVDRFESGEALETLLARPEA